MRLHHSPDLSTFPGFKLTWYVYIICFLKRRLNCTSFSPAYLQPSSIRFTYNASPLEKIIVEKQCDTKFKSKLKDAELENCYIKTWMNVKFQTWVTPWFLMWLTFLFWYPHSIQPGADVWALISIKLSTRSRISSLYWDLRSKWLKWYLMGESPQKLLLVCTSTLALMVGTTR